MNLAITLGLPVEQLPELFNSAMKLGYALGISTEKSIQSLAIGIGRQSYMVLDNIGVVFRSQVAYDWYKQTKGLNKLSAIERRKAWQLYAIKEVREKADLLTQKPTDKTRIERLHATLTNAQRKIGKMVLAK